MDDAGEVFLARCESGRWKFHSRAELEIPRGNIIEKMRGERDQARVP